MTDRSSFLAMAAAAVALAAVAGLGVGALWPEHAASAGSPAAAPSKPSTAPTKAAPAPAISLVGDMARAAPGSRINLTGHASGSGVALQVQERSNGSWVDFPADGTTRSDGTFASYVLFGRAGVHVLRVTAPSTGTVSNPITVTVG
jgi:FtsP/CotA-like multicopper oxidase with cupredoxin domain